MRADDVGGSEETAIIVEFDLHKVVITLSYFTDIHTLLSYGFLVKKRFYLYAVELMSSK